MPKSVIILAGVANSGKSKTLHSISDGQELVGRRIYSIKRKRTCIYFSSPQELTRISCRYELVIKRIKHMIEVCDSQGCDLLILAFTMYVVKGKLNKDCITKPLEYLKRSCKQVRLVYLRKDDIRNIHLVNGLMSLLQAEEVTSRDRDWKRQGEELLKIIKTVYP